MGSPAGSKVGHGFCSAQPTQHYGSRVANLQLLNLVLGQIEENGLCFLAFDERRLAALVGYLMITAPYDGVVFARNVNTGDFVLPATGDPTQGAFSLGVSPSRSTPLYVLNRIDPVLFVVGVPEADAPYVAPGTRARVRVPGLAGRELAARVTRTSWALNSTSRTLMAQIELPNPKAEFVPGMYAYGSVLIERPDVRALPVAAVTQIGNQTYCYLAVDGKAVRTPVQTGVSDGSWVEVTGKLVRSAGSSEQSWVAFDGTEDVIDGDLMEISDGVPVTVDLGHSDNMATNIARP